VAYPKNLRGGFESMRNLKKLLAVIVAICVLATFTVPAFAADISEEAQICEDLGLLKGDTSAGVDEVYLAKETQRLQAAIIYLRLFGLEDEALAYDGEENFSDAEEMKWPEGRNILAYLHDHPELGWVGDAGKFDPYGLATPKMIYKVLLTALGYVEDVDFTWDETLEFAEEKGLSLIADVETVTNDDLAVALVEALKVNIKDGSKTFAAKLIEDGLIDKAKAVEYGLYSDVLSATAAQTGAKAITVTFNRALTAAEKEAATFDVKNGLVSYNVTAKWAEDNKSVVLEYAYNYFAGDYTITIGGIADPITVKVVEEKVTKITINNDYLPKSTQAALDYTVYNQFDEKMTGQTLSINVYNATKGVSYTPVSDIINLSGADKDNVIIITISHYATGVSVSKSVPVGDVAAVTEMQLGEVAPLKNKTRISVSETGLVLPYTFKDQFGKTLKLPNHVAGNMDDDTSSETIGGIKFMTSNADIISPDTFAVDADGVLTFNTGSTAGTVIISAIAPASGKVATVTIKVEAAAALKTFTISNPGKLVAQGDTVTIPYTAVDSYGAPIEAKDLNAGKRTDLKFLSSNTSVINPSSDIKFNGKNELIITPSGSGTVTLYATVGGVLQNSITLDVKAVAVPTRIVGIKNLPLLFQKDATATIKAANIDIIDQYNRPISVGTYNDVAYSVVVSVDDGNGDKVSLTGSTITNSSDSLTLKGESAGSEAIKFVLKKGTDDQSTYKATFKTIADSDITGYTIDTIGTLYKTSAAAYQVTPKLLGTDASGNKVTINQGIITAITSSDINTVAVSGTKIYGVKAGTATIAIWRNATKLAEATVEVSDVAPYAASAKFDKASYTVTDTTSVTVTLTVKDQYGVTIDNPVGVWVIEDVKGEIATLNVTSDTTATITKVAAGVTSISYITNTGIVVSAEVVCN